LRGCTKSADCPTECIFVDPIADLAVLGAPDNQALDEEALAWDDLRPSR
jgi:hypothetical protein